MDIPHHTPGDSEPTFEQRIEASPMHQWLRAVGTTVDEHLDRALVPANALDLRRHFSEIMMIRGEIPALASDLGAKTFARKVASYLNEHKVKPDDGIILFALFTNLLPQWVDYERRRSGPAN